MRKIEDVHLIHTDCMVFMNANILSLQDKGYEFVGPIVFDTDDYYGATMVKYEEQD